MKIDERKPQHVFNLHKFSELFKKVQNEINFITFKRDTNLIFKLYSQNIELLLYLWVSSRKKVYVRLEIIPEKIFVSLDELESQNKIEFHDIPSSKK